jgi:hypothetical protein
MTFFRLLWSFIRQPQEWLDLLENRIWIPEDDFEEPKPNHRTMWDEQSRKD